MQTTSFPEPSSSDLSVCPSFSTYSISAQLADDVVSGVHRQVQSQAGEAPEEDDFEFVSLSENPDLESNIGGGGGGIRQVFPVFNRDLLRRDAAAAEESICVSLEKLFLEDDGDDPPSSSSSSEADELESVAPGTYCVWTPKLAEPSPSRCEKSNSTGSSATAKQSRRWRFRYLLKRSNSEGGKDSHLAFLTPESEKKLKQKADGGKNSKTPARPAGKAVSAHEKFYVRNRKLKEEDKRRSYLPYRRGLVGFFSDVNGLGKTFPPF